MAYKKSGILEESITAQLFEYQRDYQEIDTKLNNPKAIRELQIDYQPTISNRLSAVWSGVSNSSYGPTPMHREVLQIAVDEMNDLKPKLEGLKMNLNSLRKDLVDAGAPEVID